VNLKKVRPLVRARRRREGRGKFYVGTEECHGVDWIHVAQRGVGRGTAVNPIMKLGYFCTCYSFKKGLLRRVAKNLTSWRRNYFFNFVHPVY